MAKTVFPAMMTRRMKYNLTDKAQEISKKVQQVLKKHFGSIDGDINCTTKGGKVTGIYKIATKEGVTGFISSEVLLKVSGENVPAVTFSGELESKEENALKGVKLDCLKFFGSARKDVDAYLQDYNEIDNPEEEDVGPGPTELTDAAWKKFKNKTLLDTGMGKVLRDWESARNACDGPPTRSLEAFKTAEEALNQVALIVGKTRDAASETFHKSTLTALKAYPNLVKTARESLTKSKQTYQEFVESWKTVSSKCVENMRLLDLEMRGAISNGVSRVLSVCNETKSSTKVPDREKSVRLAEAMTKELTRLQNMADVKYKESVAALGKDKAPHTSDHTIAVDDIVSAMTELQKNITKNRKEAELKLQTAIKDNK